MAFEELVQKVKEIYKDADASAIQEHVAIQFNVYGQAEGKFYLEIKDGEIDIQPFEYYDRDVIIQTTVDTLFDIMEGRFDIGQVYAMKTAKFVGNLHKAALLRNIIID